MKNLKQFFAIFIIILLSSFVITNISFAQTHIPEGNVSGTWTIEGSPYIVDGDVTIPLDSTLIIEPGVSVIFSTLGFEILGRLLAEGTDNDSILFTVADTVNRTALGFYDLDVTDQDSSFVSYSKFEYIGVYFNQSSKARIENGIINKRRMYFYDSNAFVKNVTISNNSSPGSYGGGITCTESSCPRLVNVTVVGNSATCGGGISCRYNSSPTLENVSIMNNTAQAAGGGMFCAESDPILNYVEIAGNYVSNGIGGGIDLSDNSNPEISNVTITNNYASIGGGSVVLIPVPSL